MSTLIQPGNTAVITGGASGIGLATAERFVKSGMHVLLADRDESTLAIAAEKLRGCDMGAVITRVCDVADRDDVFALKDAAFEEFGQINCLMNNAGVAVMAPVPWEGADALDKAMDGRISELADELAFRGNSRSHPLHHPSTR